MADFLDIDDPNVARSEADTGIGPQSPPSAPTPEEKIRNRELGINPMLSIPGSYAATQRDIQQRQQGFFDNITDALKLSVFNTIAKNIEDNGIRALTGLRPAGTPYDKAEFLKTIPDNLDRWTVASIMSEDTIEGATSALRRAVTRGVIEQRMGIQMTGSGIPQLIGSLFDIDAGLVFVGGGAFKAVQIAARARRLAKTMGMSGNIEKRFIGLVSGINAGAQVGAVIGGAEAALTPSYSWEDAAHMMLTATTFGGAVGFTVKMNAQLKTAHTAAVKEFRDSVEAQKEPLNMDVESMIKESDAMPRAEVEILNADQVDAGGKVEAGSKVEAQANLDEVFASTSNRVAGNYTPAERADQKASIDRIKKPGPFRAALETFLDAIGAHAEKDMKYIASGRYKTVIGNDDIVIRIGGEPEVYPDVEGVLKPLASGRLAGEYVEVMDRVQVRRWIGRAASEIRGKGSKREKLADTLAQYGVKIRDMNSANFGTTKAGKLVVIDSAQVGGPSAPKATIPSLDDFVGTKQADEVLRETEGALEIGGDDFPSAGAASVPGGPSAQPTVLLVDPNGPIPPAHGEIIKRAHKWVNDSGFNTKKAKDALSLWTKLAVSKIGAFGMQTITEMYTSKSATMNWLGGVIMESSNGLNRGRSTSATLMDNYHNRIMTPIAGEIWPHMNEWANRNNMTWFDSGFFASNEGRRAFHREINLEMNARRMNHDTGSNIPLTRDPDIKAASDKYDIAGDIGVDVAKGREGQIPLDGAEIWNKTPGWSPYRWMGAAYQRLADLGVPMKNIEAAMVEGYRRANLAEGKDALIVVRAVIQRARSRAADMDSSTASLMTGDGRAFMEATLDLNGVSPAQIKQIMDRMTGSVEDRMKEGFAKSRNNIDLSIKIENDLGLDLRIVDLIDTDMGRVWQRYSRQVSGASALARNGITNRAQRQIVFEAAQMEMRALGENPVDLNNLHALFAHFNGGPVHGYHGGVTNKGLEPVTVVAKRLAGTGLLEGLGHPQLGESGATIAQVGVQNWYRRGPMRLWDQELRKATRDVLDELSYLTGRPGRDHLIHAEYADLDDISMQERGAWIKAVSKFTQNMAFIQMYTSLFNTVRKIQQEIALAGMMDKVMRTVRKGREDPAALDSLRARFESDFGLGDAEINHFIELVESGVIEFHPEMGYVTRMNFEKWDIDMMENFGSGMRRGMNQTVQRSMAGEQDAWMSTNWGSLMVFLKTFPIQAFQKQFIRNGRMMDQQALAAMFMGLGTAYVAIQIKDVIFGRDRSEKDRAIAAFGYNNITSWVPMITDPVLTILNLNGYRINPYGPNASLVPPVVGQLDNLMRAPGAIPKVLFGDPDYYDMQAFKAIPFAGTYGISRIVDAMATKRDRPHIRGAAKEPPTVPIKPVEELILE